MTKQKLKLIKNLCYQERLAIVNRLFQRGFTADHIASLFGVTNKRIYQMITEMKGRLKTPTKRDQNFQGRSYVREIVRTRDNHRCQMCLRKQGTQRLDVHHFEPIKKSNSSYDSITNLNKMVTLCRACHSRLLVHRKK